MNRSGPDGAGSASPAAKGATPHETVMAE